MQPFPHPNDAPGKIWLRLAYWLRINSSLTRTVRGSDDSPAIELSEQKDKLVTATGDTEKQANKVWLNSVYWFSLSGNEILTSTKGRNSVANLQINALQSQPRYY